MGSSGPGVPQIDVLKAVAVWEKTGSSHQGRVVAAADRQSARQEEGGLHGRQTEIAVSDVEGCSSLCQLRRMKCKESCIAKRHVSPATCRAFAIRCKRELTNANVCTDATRGKREGREHTQTKLPAFATGPGLRQAHVRSRAAPTRGVLDPCLRPANDVSSNNRLF